MCSNNGSSWVSEKKDADLCLILTNRSPGVSRAKPPDHCQPASCSLRHSRSLDFVTSGQCTALAPPANRSLSTDCPCSNSLPQFLVTGHHACCDNTAAKGNERTGLEQEHAHSRICASVPVACTARQLGGCCAACSAASHAAPEPHHLQESAWTGHVSQLNTMQAYTECICSSCMCLI